MNETGIVAGRNNVARCRVDSPSMTREQVERPGTALNIPRTRRAGPAAENLKGHRFAAAGSTGAGPEPGPVPPVRGAAVAFGIACLLVLQAATTAGAQGNPVSLLPPVGLEDARPAPSGANERRRERETGVQDDDRLPVLLSLDPSVSPSLARRPPDRLSAGSSKDEAGEEPLPPLDEELWWHGGSYLYEPEGDKRNWPEDSAHVQRLRLPESWEKPRPLTAFQEFLGADPIHPRRGMKWFGSAGFQWEPRLVLYGSYEMFGLAIEDGGTRTDGLGHQALIDLDLRLTGTERFHVQFRPLGEKNAGGSFYQFSDPAGYRDNATGVPDRYWFEGEVFSVFGGLLDDEFTPRDYHVVLGKLPFALHNNLLMNDDAIGVVVSKNTLIVPPLSNLNLQAFYFFDDVDGFQGAHVDVAGLHATADYRRALLEATYSWAHNTQQYDLDSHYTAFSATQFFGPVTLAGRVLSRWEEAGRRGDGQLYVLESNLHRVFPYAFRCATGIEHAVFYLNAFKATRGWNTISGGNFDRLRSTFEVSPLVQLARGVRADDTAGVALGVQLYRHHEDESILPEIVWEETGGEAIFGGGVRYLRKIGPRTYIDLRGVKTFSDDDGLQREGVFFSTFLII